MRNLFVHLLAVVFVTRELFYGFHMVICRQRIISALKILEIKTTIFCQKQIVCTSFTNFILSVFCLNSKVI